MKKMLLVMLLCTCAAFAQDTTKKAPDMPNMRTYYMAFLYRGDKWTPEQNEYTKKIQEGHMQNINRLAAEGKLLIAGPFLDDKELRGIFIFKVDSMEEAQNLCDTDPAVQAGRLRVEIKPWFADKGLTVLPH